MKRVMLLAVFGVMLGGCASEYRTGVVLLPGEEAQARVMGERPLVKIETGPAPVELHWVSPGRDEWLTVQGMMQQRMRGDTTMDLANRGDAPAQVQITVRGATGLAVEKPVKK